MLWLSSKFSYSLLDLVSKIRNHVAIIPQYALGFGKYILLQTKGFPSKHEFYFRFEESLE